MPLLSTNELRELIDHQQTPCVSIYLPTHTAGFEIQQDPIRFKNLVTKAVEELEKTGMRRTDAEKFLEPAKNLDDGDFWRHQNEGLVVFVSDGFFRYYRLPLNFQEITVVDDRFHLKPLLPLLTGDGRFYILAMSLNKVRLLEGTRYRVSDINLTDLEDVPQTLRQMLSWEDTQEDQNQFYDASTTMHTGAPGSDPGTFHGRGVNEDKAEEVRRFFGRLNQALQEFLHDKHTPLLLAGVEEWIPIFQGVNSYPYLVEDEYIRGNPDEMKPEELHEKAWQIMQPRFEKAQKEAAERYAAFTGNNGVQASDNVPEVVKAAALKRVDSLFVALNQHQWGKYDINNNDVDLHDQKQAGDDDLLDFAAIQTLINGGTVYAVEEDEIPANAPVAATFRY
ncbi:MAG: hypothetical protein ACOC0N_00935 [Chroococcales cyanobacterium]